MVLASERSTASAAARARAGFRLHSIARTKTMTGRNILAPPSAGPGDTGERSARSAFTLLSGVGQAQARPPQRALHAQQ